MSDDIKKVALPCGVDGQMYWDGMLVAITNDKFCSLRSNFKQELFEQFQGQLYVCVDNIFNGVLIIFLFFIHLLFLEDKQTGWSPPSDDCGRVFVKIRNWSKVYDELEISYDESEQFLRFLDKYVSRAIGNHQMAKFCRVNRDKTLLDKVTSSDIAYTILVYENTKEVWEEEISIRASDKTDEEKRKTIRRQKPKYHEGCGKRLKRYADGWTDDGRNYFKELMSIFRQLKNNEVWNKLHEYWGMYQLKYYGRQKRYDNNEEQDTDNDVNDESEEEDWRIDLENDDINDEVEIDEETSDVEEELYDNRRKRARIAGV